ncbi:iron uptake porin [Dolichospermum circinale CS-1225]|uniref:iron uptake porin n=1 Tax=Dolichospermum circinale TaxID=109265 RepID=UPI0003FD1F69|nr:iron uptake porin [Dolichospermum circinale]MDB9522581.1 iron uptake porin [Dolichospermum circinale CS-1225]
MSNILWKSLVVSPAALGAALLLSSTAIAATTTTTETSSIETSSATEVSQKPEVLVEETKAAQFLAQAKVNRFNNENNNSQSQVTSVSQFSDVQPTDWAFQALQSLVERYGCIAGYPSGTFRGNRSLSRYEFAAGLNSCLDRVNELIATATADLVTKQDLATLQRLQEEFSAELATLRGRVDALEGRTAELEANQFSTTTKLKGEAIFAATDTFGNETGKANRAVLQNRVRLGLETSFTGRDMLTTRLSAGNATAFDIRDNANAPINPANAGIRSNAAGKQIFEVGSTNNNSVKIDKLTYEAPVGPARVYLAASGGQHSDYAAVNNPYFFDKTDGGKGALTTFASENPIYRIGGGSGIALSVPFGKGNNSLKPSSLTLGYLASNANNPTPSNGLFDGNYAALGQLNFNVGNRVALAATYVHGYQKAGSTLFDSAIDGGSALVGTSQANTPTVPGPSSSNSYGISAAIKPSQKLSLSGFVSYHDVIPEGAGVSREAWSYGAGLALPDFGKKGNVLGIFGGAQPYSLRAGASQTPYQVEGFYKYQVSDNIAVTPGVIWVTSPGQATNSNDAFIGTLRTTFSF